MTRSNVENTELILNYGSKYRLSSACPNPVVSPSSEAALEVFAHLNDNGKIRDGGEAILRIALRSRAASPCSMEIDGEEDEEDDGESETDKADDEDADDESRV